MALRASPSYPVVRIYYLLWAKGDGLAKEIYSNPGLLLNPLNSPGLFVQLQLTEGINRARFELCITMIFVVITKSNLLFLA